MRQLASYGAVSYTRLLRHVHTRDDMRQWRLLAEMQGYFAATADAILG
jgi:hypothetical protein